MASKVEFRSGLVDMLKEDHARVKGLFKKFESAKGGHRAEIAKTAIRELEIHAELEETLIYPILWKALDEKNVINEAVEEHHLAHVIIASLKKLKPAHPKFQAKFTVLGELVKHHIEQEEDKMLPQSENREINWAALETKVMERKRALRAKSPVMNE